MDHCICNTKALIFHNNEIEDCLIETFSGKFYAIGLECCHFHEEVAKSLPRVFDSLDFVSTKRTNSIKGF